MARMCRALYFVGLPYTSQCEVRQVENTRADGLVHLPHSQGAAVAIIIFSNEFTENTVPEMAIYAVKPNSKRASIL